MSGFEIIALIGTVASAAGQFIAAKGAQQQAEGEARIMEANARAAREDANNRQAEAQRKARIREEEGRQAIATAQTKAAASGAGLVGVSTITQGIAKQASLNARNEMYEGDTAARALNQEADTLVMGAQGKRQGGNIAKKAGMLAAGSQLAMGIYDIKKPAASSASLRYA